MSKTNHTVGVILEPQLQYVRFTVDAPQQNIYLTDVKDWPWDLLVFLQS